ncbi:hypothetical protein CDL15_Pgr005040 [Punica granatum]|uniref:Uncharacterized protein n=1 Tax=Punica granatum TaxID=22663 RepID=A0A218WBC0_PUNGR|nr:hypothetical protein CDL15_Pgr005040 [Punica granatum]
MTNARLAHAADHSLKPSGGPYGGKATRLLLKPRQMTPGVARARLRLQTDQFASAGASEMPSGIDLHFCLPYTLAFTALGTSDPRTSCPHLLLSTGFGLAFAALGTSGPRTSCPHLLLSELRVHFTAFCGLWPLTYHFTSSKSQSGYCLMAREASYHRE